MSEAETTDGNDELNTHIAVCEACGIHTEERHTQESAKRLCETHNENRGCGEAEAVPVCWVCHDRATHRSNQPPYQFLCEDHVVSIDTVPLGDWEAPGPDSDTGGDTDG